jgi:hypothetical protein
MVIRFQFFLYRDYGALLAAAARKRSLETARKHAANGRTVMLSARN